VPSDPAIAETLAKLQLPPYLQVTTPDNVGFVPLPLRRQGHSKQETAEAIRDGRRAIQRMTALGGKSTGSTSISGTSSNMRLSARRTSLSTVLEQDFTVSGKKSSLLCPFSRPIQRIKASSTMSSNRPATTSDGKEPIPHHSADPICAAMYAETMASPPPSATDATAKCPIRYLDQHSPEEVAAYFETHKHEIPRSHEVCVKRYQRNEDDIKKLDAKYGNLVSMIQGLGEKHQPMLPTDAEERDEELERTSIERVENWANAVSADGIGQVDDVEPQDDEDDRESRFDRPLKEIRVGESPSRPWGIQVPIFDAPTDDRRPISPPPAPVYSEHIPKQAGKCSFGQGRQEVKVEPKTEAESTNLDQVAEYSEAPKQPAGECPFGHGQAPKAEEPRVSKPSPSPAAVHTAPTFIQAPTATQLGKNGLPAPQMVFTGPVFIGYPMEQALAFMQQYKSM
jgi:hypothetical protein